MSKLPIYDRLVNFADHINISSELDTIISVNINQLSAVEAEIIYALIIHHGNITGQAIVDGAPFAGKCNKNSKGILYSFDDMPDILRKIIVIYVLCRLI